MSARDDAIPHEPRAHAPCDDARVTAQDAPRDHRATAIVLGCAILAALVVCVIAARGDGSLLVPRNGGRPVGDTFWSWVFLASLVGAFLVYVAAVVLAARGHIAVRLALAIGVAIQLAPLASPLVLSTDAWTYWDYGRIAVVHDGNPYVDPPSAFPNDPAHAYVGARWADTPNVYGPLFTLGVAPIARVAGDSADAAAWMFKAIAALAMIAAMFGASRVARRPTLAAIVVGWSPLLAIQAAGAGHNDAWIAALAVGAIVASRARRPMLAGALWALAALVKWVPLLLVPLIGIAGIVRARSAQAIDAGTARRDLVRTLAGFVLAAGVGIAIACVRYSTSWLAAFGPISRNAHTATGYSFAFRLGQLGLPDAAARIIPLVVLAVAGLYVLRFALRGRARIGLAICALVACSPLIAPWYLLWAVPLAVTDEDDTLPVVLAMILTGALLVQGIPIHG